MGSRGKSREITPKPGYVIKGLSNAPGGGKIFINVCSHDIVGRLMIHCARQRGLGKVIEQLVGFEGNGTAQPVLQQSV